MRSFFAIFLYFLAQGGLYAKSDVPGPPAQISDSEKGSPSTTSSCSSPGDHTTNRFSATTRKPEPTSFQWQKAWTQNLMFLGIQHGSRMFQPTTRKYLPGPFVKDYLNSASGLFDKGWGDKDRFAANYVAHPMQGATYGWMQVQNDPKYRDVQFGMTHRYWISRSRALGFAAMASTQYEIGPISDASIGNVGLDPDTKGWVDMVVTPTAGIGFMILEDALDRWIIVPFEGSVSNPWARMMVRSFLNPSRSMANLLRFQKPWHRDTRDGLFRPPTPVSTAPGNGH